VDKKPLCRGDSARKNNKDRDQFKRRKEKNCGFPGDLSEEKDDFLTELSGDSF